MCCLVVFQHNLNDQCLPHGKEKLLLQDPLSQKEKLFTSASTRNHRKRILRCKWTSVALVIVSSESIEQNDNDFEVNVVAYAFAKIFQPETCWNVTNKLYHGQFLRRSRTGGAKVQVTGHRSQVTGYRSQVTDYRSQVTGRRLQVTG